MTELRASHYLEGGCNQTYLIDNGYDIRSGATGYFGEITREALQKFQSDKGISPVSGYFGPKTRAFINDQKTVSN